MLQETPDIASGQISVQTLGVRQYTWFGGFPSEAALAGLPNAYTFNACLPSCPGQSRSVGVFPYPFLGGCLVARPAYARPPLRRRTTRWPSEKTALAAGRRTLGFTKSLF